MTLLRFLPGRIRRFLSGDKRFARLAFIETYRFPDSVRARFAAEQPDFDESERLEIFEALRDYFAICAADPPRRAGMPSRIVDEAWHTFILFTREYSEFCQRAFGGYLHHAPADARGNDADLGHTWRVACARENVPAAHPSRLPRLFGIDRRLSVPGARYYALNETDADRARAMLGASAVIALASGLGGGERWDDPIFMDLRASAAHMHSAGGLGGDAPGFTDAGGADGGSGGCSGGGN